MNATGLGLLAVGIVLCFAGVRSLNLAVLVSGFALGWLAAEPFGADLPTSFLIALAAGVLALVLARFVFRVALFFVGGLAGAVIGAKLFGLLEPDDPSVVLMVLFVAAAGFIGGVATQRFRLTALAAVCALGGGALILSGLARAFPGTLGFLRDPAAGWEAVLTTVAWIVVAAVGWSVQRQNIRRLR